MKTNELFKDLFIIVVSIVFGGLTAVSWILLCSGYRILMSVYLFILLVLVVWFTVEYARGTIEIGGWKDEPGLFERNIETVRGLLWKLIPGGRSSNKKSNKE